MTIFQPKKTGPIDYFDRITIGGYDFDAIISVRKERGDPSAIHCGRIVSFELLCCNEFVGYFDDGQWYLSPGCREGIESGDPFWSAASMAQELLIKKWSNPEKIKLKEEAPF